MLLGFKTELKLNNKQRTLLLQHSGVARHAWNWGLALTKQILDHNKSNPADKIKFPSAIDLHKWLFTLDGSFKLEAFRIKVPVIGWIKTYERLPQISVKAVTISRKANSWFISFRIETASTETEKVVKAVGVDLGIKSLATLSTGEVFLGAKSYRRNEIKLKRLQRAASRKIKGSNNQRKCYEKIAKQHARVANIRKDTLHKLTSYLAKNHSLIGIENLNVAGMLSNRKLAKAIQDMGFYEFRRQLEYKTKLYGSRLVVIDRWFPSSKTCSNCGCIKESLSLSERVFNCDDCGFSIDRDDNASINIELAAVALAEA